MAVFVTACSPENLDKIKSKIKIRNLVLLIRSQTVATVDIAPPNGHAHSPGWDNSPVNLSKKLKGKELRRSTNPPSRVPPIWLTVSGSFIYFEAINLINNATAKTPPVDPNHM